MRSKAAVMIALVLGVTLAACGSKIETGRVTRAPADLTSGFAEVKVPLPTRQSPMVVAAGKHVIVYGGYRIGGSQEAPRGDGADYDIVRGEWRQMPPAPFDRPLHLAAGVWTGSEVVVVGTPCGATSTDQELAKCATGGITAAAYSPRAGTWRKLPPPDVPVHPSFGLGAPFTGVGIGWSGGKAIFETDILDPQWRFLAVDPTSGHWQQILAIAGATTTDVVGGKLVAVELSEAASNGVFVPNPLGVAQPLRTSTWDAASASWGQPVSTPKPASTGATSERVIGAADQLAYFPIKGPPDGLGLGALWYESGPQRWSELPAFGVANRYDLGSIAEVRGTKVVSVGPPYGAKTGSFFVLPAGGSAWVERSSPVAELRGFQSLDDLVLVSPLSDQRSIDHMAIGLLDPARYVNGSDGTSK